jgi:hypothetical protein
MNDILLLIKRYRELLMILFLEKKRQFLGTSIEKLINTLIIQFSKKFVYF